MSESSDASYGIVVPVEAHSVDSPIVSYGGNIPASINFVTDDDRWGRVTFEKFDSLRVSRGEHDPYPSDRKPDTPFAWVSTVKPSSWLHERYKYEKKFYGEAYEFGGTVEEMLSDYSHYIFNFHDEFVEVLCDGIWFEVGDGCFKDSELAMNHPFRELGWKVGDETFEAAGIVCQVRRNAQPIDALIKGAELCSQKLFQFAAVLDGNASVDWTVTLRVRNGKLTSQLRRNFGKLEKRYEGVVELATVRPRIEKWLREVKERRKSMGKD
ncbi:MAG: hypothetical protein JNN20_20215 [Betaproteobacteria bacterium]|nr:hypothetical protein [Betaproteobacteria bacterium]